MRRAQTELESGEKNTKATSAMIEIQRRKTKGHHNEWRVRFRPARLLCLSLGLPGVGRSKGYTCVQPVGYMPK